MNNSIQTLQGGTRLVFDSVEGITTAVEGMHKIIASPRLPGLRLPARPGPAHGLIASAVYASIRGANGLLRDGVDRSFNLVPARGETSSTAEIRSIAALNGVCGDHLEASANPLAIAMQLRANGQRLALEEAALSAALPQASPHLVIMVHGLSMSELGWTRKGQPCIGSRLQAELGSTPLYLRYNSGRHISTNGQQFAQMLEDLCRAWPVPVESLCLVGHSMGGLVIRSACWYAQAEQQQWLSLVQKIACLGTPHHGSPLERAGHALDVAMQKIPYTRPLAFGRLRSAGIKDLRHGNLLDEDWQGHHPDQPRPDQRKPVPLLPDIDYYFAAATLGQHKHDPIGHILGDLLVRLDSAVGSHKDELRSLDIKKENCRVFHEKNHFDLLDDERVHRQIVQWFRAG